MAFQRNEYFLVLLVEIVYSLADVQTILHGPIGKSKKLELETFDFLVDLLACSSDTF